MSIFININITFLHTMCLVKNNGSKRHECDMIDIDIYNTYISLYLHHLRIKFSTLDCEAGVPCDVGSPEEYESPNPPSFLTDAHSIVKFLIKKNKNCD